MRHLGYFWPNYKHYFGTVSPLSMGECSWFSFLQKTLVFRSKTCSQNKILAVKNLHNGVRWQGAFMILTGGIYDWICNCIVINFECSILHQHEKPPKKIQSWDRAQSTYPCTIQGPNAFRMRQRHGRFPFTSGLPQVKGNVIPHESWEVHTNSPRHGLAGLVKNKFVPQEAKPWVLGICFLPQLLNHKWGIGMNLEWRVGNYSRDFVSS